jgi:predicted RNase H-like HicB family nuclease
MCHLELCVRYSNKLAFNHGGFCMRYAVVIEKGANGFGAYVPDLPGCIAAAKTRGEVVKLIQDAMEFHIEGLKQDGEPVPKPTSSVEFVEVAA